jgi:hypothetical protein
MIKGKLFMGLVAGGTYFADLQWQDMIMDHFYLSLCRG